MTLAVAVSEIVENSTNPLLQIHPSWQRVMLSEIATVLNGYAFESSRFNKDERGMPLLRIRDVGKHETDCFYEGPFEPTYIVEPGDLVVGMDGDFNCARWSGPKALLNQRVCKITIKSAGYLPKFLDIALPGYLKAINDRTSSVTVKHLSSRSIAEIPLPLPSLPEQHHIVAKIEEQFTRLDAGVAALKRAQANLKRYKASVLKAACEGKLVAQDASDEPASELLKRILAERRTKWEADLRAKGKDPKKAKYEEPVVPYKSEAQQLPDSWIVASVDALTSRVTYGITVRPEYVEDGIPVISAREIRSGTIDFDIAKRISEKDFSTLRSNCKIQENDVLFSKTGSIGHVARVKTSEPLCSSQNIAVLSPLINPAYLELVLRTPIIQRLASKSVKTTAVPDLQLGILKQFPVRLPPELNNAASWPKSNGGCRWCRNSKRR